jgi:hypothetical protein
VEQVVQVIPLVQRVPEILEIQVMLEIPRAPMILVVPKMPRIPGDDQGMSGN